MSDDIPESQVKLIEEKIADLLGWLAMQGLAGTVIVRNSHLGEMRMSTDPGYQDSFAADANYVTAYDGKLNGKSVTAARKLFGSGR